MEVIHDQGGRQGRSVSPDKCGVSIHSKVRGDLTADYNCAMGAYSVDKKKKVSIVLDNVIRCHDLQLQRFRLDVRRKINFLGGWEGLNPQPSLPSLPSINSFPQHHERIREQLISEQRRCGLATAYMPNCT